MKHEPISAHARPKIIAKVAETGTWEATRSGAHVKISRTLNLLDEHQIELEVRRHRHVIRETAENVTSAILSANSIIRGYGI